MDDVFNFVIAAFYFLIGALWSAGSFAIEHWQVSLGVLLWLLTFWVLTLILTQLRVIERRVYCLECWVLKKKPNQFTLRDMYWCERKYFLSKLANDRGFKDMKEPMENFHSG